MQTILSKRSELHNLQKELKKKERELEKLRAVSEKWDYAIRSGSMWQKKWD